MAAAATAAGDRSTSPPPRHHSDFCRAFTPPSTLTTPVSHRPLYLSLPRPPRPLPSQVAASSFLGLHHIGLYSALNPAAHHQISPPSKPKQPSLQRKSSTRPELLIPIILYRSSRSYSSEPPTSLTLCRVHLRHHLFQTRGPHLPAIFIIPLCRSELTPSQGPIIATVPLQLHHCRNLSFFPLFVSASDRANPIIP